MMRDFNQGYQSGFGQYPMHYGWGMPSLVELFCMFFAIVLFVDAVLLGLWLWKQINKK